ncbi:MAG: hypothetical protein K2O45_01065 [Oscillospiraceae bacterium]|nr:hypothetical protein [Oscillospiraceae bacterium]
MDNTFDWNLCLAYLKKGDLRSPMEYLAQFPEHADLYQKYVSIFQQEKYLSYDIDSGLQDILLIYQKYYRDAFYLEQSAEDAAGRLRARLADLFQTDPAAPLDELEERAADTFRSHSMYVLTGRTNGYYGPYIWRYEELKHYAVELPDGVQEYAVKLLDGFVMESWLNYLTFGMSGTGGWSNGDGLIHCVKHNYDLDSESFQVSLLKHEAQHAADQSRYPGMSPEDLEYRAKLVELIYSEKRLLLDRFLMEADATSASNGHGLAAERITRGFEARLNKDRKKLAGLPVQEVQMVSFALFQESTGEMGRKYLGSPA